MNSGFPMVSLGRVVRPIERLEPVVAGKLYRQIGVRLWGEGAYEREAIDGSQTRYQALSLVETNDIIVNKIWARNGSVAVVTEKLAGCYGSGEFPTFIPDLTSLEPSWFHWLTKTRSFWVQCDEKSQGTSGKNRIRPEQFLKVEIPLPSLEEQRRIVARIEELAARIAEVHRLRREAVNGVEGLMGEELDRTFANVVEKYETIIFGNAGGFVTSGPRGWGDYYNENGDRRLIRVENVWDKKLDLSIAARVMLPPDAGDIERSQARIGDVLVTITGAIGRVGVVEEFDLPCHVSQHVALVRPPHSISPNYLYWYLQSPSFGKLQTEGKTYGATKPGINLTSLRMLQIATPPLSEQRRIVAYLDDLQARVDALKQLQAETQAELDALLPSVLDKAFRGELV
jgi:type I restriction enzyme S subunit